MTRRMNPTLMHMYSLWQVNIESFKEVKNPELIGIT